MNEAAAMKLLQLIAEPLPVLLVIGIADMQTASNTLCIVALRDHTSYTS
jgi:hypothetical protein